MKSKLYALAVFGIACFIFIYMKLIKPQPPGFGMHQNTSQKSMSENEQTDEMDKALLQEIEKTKDPATGDVPVERLLVAEQIQQQKFAQQARLNTNSPVPGVSWTERGPNNVGGRTRAI